jgi:hypothetical protein
MVQHPLGRSTDNLGMPTKAIAAGLEKGSSGTASVLDPELEREMAANPEGRFNAIVRSRASREKLIALICGLDGACQFGGLGRGLFLVMGASPEALRALAASPLIGEVSRERTVHASETGRGWFVATDDLYERS